MDIALLPDTMWAAALMSSPVSDIVAQQHLDPFVMNLQQQTNPLHLTGLHFVNDTLYFHDCLYIPPDHCTALLHTHHDPPLAGHPDYHTLLNALECWCWWPGLSHSVWLFLCGCFLCQQMKPHCRPLLPSHVGIPPCEGPGSLTGYEPFTLTLKHRPGRKMLFEHWGLYRDF